MNLPKVSVVIPNYNHGDYLQQRIDSVLNQTYRNFEIIILDDCSTDHSREVIKTYGNNPLIRKTIFNDKNSGSPFKQWRRGIELSEGEWIWIAESDDYADERFLEVLISACQNQPNVGLVYCDSSIITNGIVVSETFATIKNRKFKTNRWSKNYINSGTDEIENFLLNESTINNTSAVLFNKSVLSSVNVFDINLQYIGDKYVFVKVLSKSDVLYVKDSLNYYRDPFNTKHSDKFIFYFYEQFLVFNWVYKNLALRDKRKILETFCQNTNFSMYTNWSNGKLVILKKLALANPRLLIRCIIYNLKRPFVSFG